MERTEATPNFDDLAFDEAKIESQRMPLAAWAWEYLRRNEEYQRDYRASRPGRQNPIQLKTGAMLIRERRRWLRAEKWGLLTFTNPEKSAFDADVFWRPDVLAGTLPVELLPVGKEVDPNDPEHVEVVLSAIKTRRTLLDTVDGARHILINGRRFWVQLYCQNPRPLHDHSAIGIALKNAKYMRRRLETAGQLLSLYHSTGAKLSLIGRTKRSKRLTRGLIAYDIIRDGGNHRDVADRLFNSDIIAREWNAANEHYRDRIRKLINRVQYLVEGGYQTLLTQK